MSSEPTASGPGDFSGHDLATDPLAVQVEKRPVEREVRFAEAEGILDTREGPVRYQPGDALLDDGAGFRWPVVRARFEASYKPVPPTRQGEPGRYAARPLGALARRMDRAFSVRVGRSGDVLRGAAGDWLLQYGAGDYGVVDAGAFERTYAVRPLGETKPAT
ncbi:MAG: PGDYG domain-containing protein [Gammaproteobacteria bacterium]|nr:PGDYG domain-containing protein [Gammaproteobacteria bacterium]MBU1444289.1 PGDYG domain-containing protein [Gammaproteobacteria bacterium]MBU2288751.1 PGDYG domain-containing protein [Gammaproteobacteria bacterium]MBU2408704.1 PGDYG domain-containing protein [Gammaproteobacteria bacterium]